MVLYLVFVLCRQFLREVADVCVSGLRSASVFCGCGYCLWWVLQFGLFPPVFLGFPSRVLAGLLFLVVCEQA